MSMIVSPIMEIRQDNEANTLTASMTREIKSAGLLSLLDEAPRLQCPLDPAFSILIGTMRDGTA